ncbi:MAG TPA: hypothetical protein VKA50_06410 [Gammaproteobacteria bacterium]|nr:hypothetical protein [Gammaproteobacteria bacterium]
MKTGARDMIGKRISGVVFKSPRDRRAAPNSQVFLLFDDGTYFELYSLGTPILPTGAVRTGRLADVIAYLAEAYQLDFMAAVEPTATEVASIESRVAR